MSDDRTNQIVVDLKGKFAHELAEADAELMRLWGEIGNAWDQIERLLYQAFDAMLSEENGFATQAVFYSQRAHAARRSMVEALAEYALLNRPQTARKLKDALARVRARSDDRHKLIHGAWSYGVDLATGEHGPQRIALDEKIIPGPKDVYSRQRLEVVRDSMRDTAQALSAAIEPIDAAKRAKAVQLAERHMEKASS